MKKFLLGTGSTMFLIMIALSMIGPMPTWVAPLLFFYGMVANASLLTKINIIEDLEEELESSEKVNENLNELLAKEKKELKFSRDNFENKMENEKIRLHNMFQDKESEINLLKIELNVLYDEIDRLSKIIWNQKQEIGVGSLLDLQQKEKEKLIYSSANLDLKKGYKELEEKTKFFGEQNKKLILTVKEQDERLKKIMNIIGV